MTSSNQQAVVGIFDDRQRAYAAVAELRQVGFEDGDIWVGAPNAEGPGGPSTWHTGAAFGAMIGALSGVALGPAAVLGTILVGGIVGALIDLGIPEQDARWYQSEVEAGRILVTVRAGNRDVEVRDIFRRHQGAIAPTPVARE